MNLGVYIIEICKLIGDFKPTDILGITAIGNIASDGYLSSPLDFDGFFKRWTSISTFFSPAMQNNEKMVTPALFLCSDIESQVNEALRLGQQKIKSICKFSSSMQDVVKHLVDLRRSNDQLLLDAPIQPEERNIFLKTKRCK